MDSPLASSPLTSTSQPPQGEERSVYLSRSGHEMRNPLANILALVEGLQDGLYGDVGVKQSEAISGVAENAHRLLSLLNAFIDEGKIVLGSVTLQSGQVLLDEIVEEVRRQAEPGASAKTLEISAQVIPAGLSAEGDRKRLSQMAAEMLGGILVSIPSKGTLQLSLEGDVSRGLLTIRAWGAPSGITDSDAGSPSPAALERLRKLKGIGIGLVERLAVLHGGSALEAFELPKNGLLLRVQVPLGLELPAPRPDQVELLAPGEAIIGARGPHANESDQSPLILLVDDEDVLRDITHDYLESVGYRVLSAKNGREGLTLATTERPNLIIMDVLMPVMDGLEALQELRGHADPAIARIPVISMSGMAVSSERDKCLAAGANACLTKPFGIKQLEIAMGEFVHGPDTESEG